MDFCHLHLHTEYSMLDGLGTTDHYATKARKLGYKYLAITDHANIDGLIKFQKSCIKEGVKPILGCELYIVPEIETKTKKRGHVLVLVKDQEGFTNLCNMLTYANTEGFYYKPRVTHEVLLNHCKGLVVSTACLQTFMYSKGGEALFQNLHESIGGDLYCEVMPHDLKRQKRLNRLCQKIHKQYGTKIIATNDCHYINRTHTQAHEVLLAIQQKAVWTDPKRWRFSIKGLHLRTVKEMKQAFIEQGFYNKRYFLNTIEVAEKCSNFLIPKYPVRLPRVKGIKTKEEADSLEYICNAGYKKLFNKQLRFNNLYYDRFKEEFKLIKSKKFIRYFLIVWELVNWCKKNDIMIGPIRGSVGGCLIAYLLGIISIDPIKHNLMFSRFINEDRIDLPDIDIDFEDQKRHLIRGHLEDMYGVDNVAGVSSFNRMKARAVIRDVSRVFKVPLAEVDQFAKLLDDNDEHTGIQDAIDEYPEAQQFAEAHPDIIRHAKKLEGQIKTYCISGDGRAQLKNNCGGIRIKKIKKLYQEGFKGKVRAYNFKTDKLFFDKVVKISYAGKRLVFDISAHMRTVRLTLNHRVLTKRGWVKVKNLIVGIDQIALNGTLASFKKGNTPWNKGTKGLQVAWNKGLTKEDHYSIKDASERWMENNPSKKLLNKVKLAKRSKTHGRQTKYHKQLLIKFPICQICKINKSTDRHHKDRDRNNGDRNNIVACCSTCHFKEHQRVVNKINKDRTIYFSRLRSITSAGVEDVYHVEMKSENQNLIVDKVVVHNSQHAAAVVVSKQAIGTSGRCNLLERKGTTLINWEKDDTEYVGLVKLDVLGLKLLSVLNDARKAIKKNHNIDIEFTNIDLNDKKVLGELNAGNTIGVFQFNKWATKNLLKEVVAENFQHLADVSALVRPGPYASGMTAEYIKRKNEGIDWERKHKVYEKITEKTYGLLVYQEQVMAVIADVAGLPYSMADNIRKVIGKKRTPQAFKKYKDVFINGCKKTKIFNRGEAIEFWEGLQKWASYGYNMAHATGYSVLGYWCGWLKVYYPTEFICAALTYGAKDKKAELVEEAYRLGLTVVLPKVGISEATNWVTKGVKLYVPFFEVNGIGPVKAIEACRISGRSGGKIDKWFDRKTETVRHKGKFGDLLASIGAYEPTQDIQITDAIKERFSFRIVTDPRQNYAKLYKLFKGKIRLDTIDRILAGDIKIIKRLSRKVKLLKRKSFEGHNRLHRCRKCELYKEGTRPVPPSAGKYNVFIIGEGPWIDEDEQGKGFVGNTGKLLWKSLKPFERELFHVTNIWKCYPRYSRKANKGQIEICTQYLKAELKAVKPILVLAFGNYALGFFTGKKGGITDMSGKVTWNEDYGCWIVYCMHPSAILHNSDNKVYYDTGIKTFKKLMRGIKL